MHRLHFVIAFVLALGAAAVGAAAAQTSAIEHGRLHEDEFFSVALGVKKHVVVYLPPSYTKTPAKRYPVAYYLHGLGGTETDWVSKAGIDGGADSLIGAGAPEAILVMPDGDDGRYTNWVDHIA